VVHGVSGPVKRRGGVVLLVSDAAAQGDLDLTYDRIDLAADPGLTSFTCTAAPGSKHEEALHFLGSWAATVEHEQAGDTADAAPLNGRYP
jgi:hypothetical protein